MKCALIATQNVRAKNMVILELQGPFLAKTGFSGLVPERCIVRLFKLFLIGVIDLAGLFVP